tara:strand:+ start:186 stop:563 length:378 start_codon:yes stop_codon:yes gene_type:complete
MDFLESIVSVLSYVKKGAEVYAALSEKDQDTGFAKPTLVDLESNLSAPKASLKQMDSPSNISIPKVQSAYDYLLANQVRDRQFQVLLARNYQVPTRNVKKQIKPNIGFDQGIVKGVRKTTKQMGA